MLSIHIESPQILIPVNPTSYDVVVAELGNILIVNEILVKPGEQVETYLQYLQFIHDFFI